MRHYTDANGGTLTVYGYGRLWRRHLRNKMHHGATYREHMSPLCCDAAGRLFYGDQHDDWSPSDVISPTCRNCALFLEAEHACNQGGLGRPLENEDACEDWQRKP